jgi:hypothetical protein
MPASTCRQSAGNGGIAPKKKSYNKSYNFEKRII